jgi:hypothetical protein
VRLIEIELCHADSSGEQILATENLNINDISSYGAEGADILPTFGPCYIEFYKEPEDSRTILSNQYEDQNDEDAENYFNNSSNIYWPVRGNGAIYVGRLCMKIYSSSVNNTNESNEIKYDRQIDKNKEESDYSIESIQDFDESATDKLIRKVLAKNNFFNTYHINKNFVAFAMIKEATMIDNRFKNGDISFQLCVGK